jgi:nitrate/nitrite transporter NarK
MALINSMGALGSFGGSYLVGYLNSSTGSPGASYLLMSGALLVSVVLTIFLKPGASDRALPKVTPRLPLAAHS